MLTACYAGGMIRRRLLLTIPALVLQLVLTSLLSFANAVVHSPTILIQPQMLAFVLGLLSPVTLVVFLLVLYWELSGHRDVRRRQLFALAAASGMGIHLGLTFWQLHESGVALSSLTPQMRAQMRAVPDLTGMWVHAAIWTMLPTIAWIAFLLIFWHEASPLSRERTGKVAAFLCVFTAVQGIYGASRLLSRLQRYIPDWTGQPIHTSWNLIISPAMLLAAWFVVPYFLFSVWRTAPAHSAEQTAAL